VFYKAGIYTLSVLIPPMGNVRTCRSASERVGAKESCLNLWT